MLLKFYIKGRHNLPEIINFFVICVNLQKFTELTFFVRFDILPFTKTFFLLYSILSIYIYYIYYTYIYIYIHIYIYILYIYIYIYIHTFIYIFIYINYLLSVLIHVLQFINHLKITLNFQSSSQT